MIDFEYQLPDRFIAQSPLDDRSSSSLLDACGFGDEFATRRFRDISSLVGPGDLIVVNDSKVIPARLHLERGTGGRIEVFLVEKTERGGEHDRWRAMAKPMRKMSPGTELYAPGNQGSGRPVLTVTGRDEVSGLIEVEVCDPEELARLGEMPLPPYIHRPIPDPSRYQTVYARNPGSVAAPTAGLHFTPELIGECRSSGALVAGVDLAVGLGTFKPVVAERPQDHVMHSERYHIPEETLALIGQANRVIAIGTTTLRALESFAATGIESGKTDLFVYGDYRFRIVDVLVTNFHQPRSTLLMLLDSFIGGRDRWRSVYAEAMSRGLRFLSFGDAMAVRRGGSPLLDSLGA